MNQAVPSFEVSVKKLFLHYSMRAEICPTVAEELVAHVCGIVVPSPAPYQIVIAAHGRKILNENGMALDRAIPSVARGTRMSATAGGGAIVLPFATEIGPFHMEICLRNTA